MKLTSDEEAIQEEALKFARKKKTVKSTIFSDFIRNAPSREKKRVYTDVLKRATERQQSIIRRAQSSGQFSSKRSLLSPPAI